MSVMILDHKVLQAISRTLISSDYSGNGGKFTLYETAYKMEYTGIEKCIRILWILLHKSYRRRYSTNKSSFHSVSFGPSFGKTLSIYELLKNMECLSYQIEIEHDELNKFNNIIKELRRVLIANLPEYNAAKWGEI